jgi:septal ring factor EnvC (AmiA/AmiB activator)
MTGKKDINLNEIITNLDEAPGFNLVDMEDSIPPEDRVKVQRSFQIEKWIWDASKNLPESNSETIRKALLNKVTAYKSEIPQLQDDVRKIDEQFEKLQAQRAAKLHRIKELEVQAGKQQEEAQLAKINRDQAVVETINILELHRRNMGAHHFKRLEQLTGISAKDIKAFITEHKFRPSEEEVRFFYNL